MLLVSLIPRGFDPEQVSIFALQLDRVLSSVLSLVPHFRMPPVYLLEAWHPLFMCILFSIHCTTTPSPLAMKMEKKTAVGSSCPRQSAQCSVSIHPCGAQHFLDCVFIMQFLFSFFFLETKSYVAQADLECTLLCSKLNLELLILIPSPKS